MKDEKDTTNSNVDRRIRRTRIAKKEGKCSHCSPHGGENACRRKHPKTKPRYKDKRS